MIEFVTGASNRTNDGNDRVRDDGGIDKCMIKFVTKIKNRACDSKLVEF